MGRGWPQAARSARQRRADGRRPGRGRPRTGALCGCVIRCLIGKGTSPKGMAQPRAQAPRKEGKGAGKESLKDGESRVNLPLSPTPEEIQRMRAAQRKEKEEQADEAHASRGRLPTQLGNTAGPKSPQGAGTAQ